MLPFFHNLIAIIVFVSIFAFSSSAYEIQLISKKMDGNAALGSDLGGITSSGDKIIFSSLSGDIIPDDENFVVIGTFMYAGQDIFIFDIATQMIKRVSVKDDGSEIGNLASCDYPDIGEDNFYVFASNSAEIVDGVTTIDGLLEDDPLYPPYRNFNVFAVDRSSNQYWWISKSPDNVEGSGSSWQPLIVSEDSKVFFRSSATNLVETPIKEADGTSAIYFWDRQTDQNHLVSSDEDDHIFQLQNSIHFQYDVSDDGRYIVFPISDLIYTPEGVSQIVLKDLVTDKIIILSKSENGEMANRDCFFPMISGDGRFVFFETNADNLMQDDPHPFDPELEIPNGYDYFYYDIEQGSLHVIPLFSYPEMIQPTFASGDCNFDGRFFVFHTINDLLRFDRTTGQVEQLGEMVTEGGLGDMAVSEDGLKIAFNAHHYRGTGSVHFIDTSKTSETSRWELFR